MVVCDKDLYALYFYAASGGIELEGAKHKSLQEEPSTGCCVLFLIIILLDSSSSFFYYYITYSYAYAGMGSLSAFFKNKNRRIDERARNR